MSALLGGGADINAVDSEGRIPLLQAAVDRDLIVAGDLLDHNADHSIADSSGQTLASVIRGHMASLNTQYFNHLIAQIWEKMAEASALAQARAQVSAIYTQVVVSLGADR
jgi:ankyrin repeat protein